MSAAESVPLSVLVKALEALAAVHALPYGVAPSIPLLSQVAKANGSLRAYVEPMLSAQMVKVHA